MSTRSPALSTSGEATVVQAQTCNPAAVLIITSVFALRDPADQARLFDLLDDDAVQLLQHTAGFLGSTLSRSDDGTTVVHHARWRNETAARTMLSSPHARASIAQTRQLADVTVIRSSTTHHYTPGPVVS